MGVEDFYGKWLLDMIRKYPRIRPDVTNLSVYSLSIDMNGLLHMVAPGTYAYNLRPNQMERRKREISELIREIRSRETDPKKIQEEVEEELFKHFVANLIDEIEKRCGMFKVSNLLNIAVDGVVPWAKCQQQRIRRFKNAGAETNYLEDDFYYFNASANITPGTPFMQKVDLAFQEWIKTRTSTRSEPKNIRYSSFMVPGEGEHKIIADMRDGIVGSDVGQNMIVGKDADLVILSLISPLQNIIVNRERKDDNVDVRELRENLLTEMNFAGNSPETCLRDFVLISFFVGNDFLPRIYQFKNVQASLDFFIKTYRRLQLPLTDPGQNIIWKNFKKYLGRVQEKNYEFIGAILEEDWEYPPKILMSTVSEDGDFLEDDFHRLWYSNAMLPRSAKGAELYRDLMVDPEPSAEDIECLCHDYLTGLQWVLRYYTSNNAKRDYLYPHFYAPLVEDLITYIPQIDEENPISIETVSSRFYTSKFGTKNADLAPRMPHQLSMVIPPTASSVLLEKKLFDYVNYEKMNELSDTAPIGVEEELDTVSRGKEHSSLAFVPPIEIKRVMKSVTLRGLSKELKNMSEDHQPIVKSAISRAVMLRLRDEAEGGRGQGRGRGRGSRNSGEFRMPFRKLTTSPTDSERPKRLVFKNDESK